MKRESSYNNSRKPGRLLRLKTLGIVKASLVVLLLVRQVESVCHENAQCPGDQVCILHNNHQSTARILQGTDHNFKVEVRRQGICGCPVNHIIWKWRCLPLVKNLGDACVVSHQCPKGLYCDPLSRTCQCPLHKSNCLDTTTTTRPIHKVHSRDYHYQSTENSTKSRNHSLEKETTSVEVSFSQDSKDSENSSLDSKRKSLEKFKSSLDRISAMADSGIIVSDSDLDKVPAHHKEILKTLISDMNKTFHESILDQSNKGNTQQLSSDQGWTPQQVHTFLYIGLAFLVIIVITLISAAYMRSLSEKRRSAAAIKSLLDMMAENRSIHSVYTMEGVYGNHANQPNYQPKQQQENEVVLTQETPASGVLEGRIKLDPIEEQPKMPSPHLSAPVLPPISKRPRPVAQKVEGLPDSSSVAAISQNLTSIKELSAASFPEEELCTTSKK